MEITSQSFKSQACLTPPSQKSEGCFWVFLHRIFDLIGRLFCSERFPKTLPTSHSNFQSVSVGFDRNEADWIEFEKGVGDLISAAHLLNRKQALSNKKAVALGFDIVRNQWKVEGRHIPDVRGCPNWQRLNAIEKESYQHLVQVADIRTVEERELLSNWSNAVKEIRKYEEEYQREQEVLLEAERVKYQECLQEGVEELRKKTLEAAEEYLEWKLKAEGLITKLESPSIRVGAAQTLQNNQIDLINWMIEKFKNKDFEDYFYKIFEKFIPIERSNIGNCMAAAKAIILKMHPYLPSEQETEGQKKRRALYIAVTKKVVANCSARELFGFNIHMKLTENLLKKTFIELCLAVAPDKNPEDRKEEATALMQCVLQAYRDLKSLATKGDIPKASVFLAKKPQEPPRLLPNAILG